MKRTALALALILCGVLAWIPRDVDGMRRPNRFWGQREEVADSGASGWFSTDPDGLYHTRRVERALQGELPAAGTDPYLNYPHGARIPWPPYYDSLLALAIGPFAPSADGPGNSNPGGLSDADYTERRAFIERAVATLPAWFGVGAVLLAAWAAFRVARGASTAARLAGALTSGGTLAFCFASINYSVIGNGDHHAWIALLNGLLLGIATVACCRGNLTRPGRSAALGVAAGAVAGLMLGSWVASLLYIINLQLVLAWLLFRRAQDRLPGVASFGFAFHLTAALVILPAVLVSPWREEFPWMVVNLSWFHPAQLLIGALVFVPPLLTGRGRLAPGTAAARRYPWLVALCLAAGAGLLWLIGSGPADGIAEGFAWVSRADSFMDTVFESRPLVGARSGGWNQLFLALGYGVLLAPLAWLALARAAFVAKLDALVPFAVALPPLLIQALAQRRFADVAALPMAVCLGWAAARLVERWSPRFPRLPRPGWPALALALALAFQWPSLERTLTLKSGVMEQLGSYDHLLGDRQAYEWIRTQYPAPERDPEAPWSVLAHWDRGHALEWAADRPTVATNFGSYVGEDSYRDPARFFLTEDPLQGRALLMERRVRHVFVPGSLPDSVESFVRIADINLANRYLIPQNGRAVTSARWLSTLSARLLNGGVQLTPPGTPLEQRGSPLGFLRLVFVSPVALPGTQAPAGAPNGGQSMPANFVWEHVPGATIAARGGPGELVRADLALRYPGPLELEDSPLTRGEYRLELSFVARCDATGVARLWIPYTTEAPNGQGVVDSASWSIGDAPSARSGPLVIPERAVFGGRSIQLP